MSFRRPVGVLLAALVTVVAVAGISVAWRSPGETPAPGSEPSPTGLSSPSASASSSATPSSSASPETPLTFTLSSFNVLGSSHTRLGSGSDMARGPERMRQAVSLLSRNDVDVVGFQELQGNQLDMFLSVTDGDYAVYPGAELGGRATQNSIAWRTGMWELVEARTVAIPYFNGHRWPMPVVLLRNSATGRSAYFINVHNPASTRRHPNQSRWRSLALATEVELVNTLVRGSSVPVFLTGDLNERELAFCTMTQKAPMTAANGGRGGPPCELPEDLRIDWIFGWRDVRFTGYKALRTPLVRRTSDHPMLVSTIHLDG